MTASALTKKDIIAGLKRLGLRAGDHVLVHTALGSFGTVTGGAKTVIDALLDTVGPDGTVLMPCFGCTDAVFDPAVSATTLGTIPEAFRRYPHVVRSGHPTASVAAMGARAHWLTADHEKARTGHGKDTPYTRLADIGGKILLMGVDQDRSTFLHAAEAVANLPYLGVRRAEYCGPDGKTHTGTWKAMPGPHRNFIGLQGSLKRYGLVSTGLIGSALCQLSPADELLDMLVEALEDDPGLFISGNPNRDDAVAQHAMILRARWRREAFTLAADSAYAGPNLEAGIEAMTRFGIKHVVLSFIGHRHWSDIEAKRRAWYLRGLKLAGIAPAAIRFHTPACVAVADLAAEARCDTVIVPATVPTETLADLAQAGLTVLLSHAAMTADQAVGRVRACTAGKIPTALAFGPLDFAMAGEKPFLDSWRRPTIRKHIGAMFVRDGLADGVPTALEHGHAEIKELISIARSRRFDGLMILQGPDAVSFVDTVEDFIDILDELGSPS